MDNSIRTMFENINTLDKRAPDDLQNNIIKQLKENIPVLIAAGVAALILVIFYIYARIKYRRGRNMIIFTIALIIADLSLDIAFLVTSIFNTPVGKGLLIPSLVALFLPAGFNLALAFTIMIQQSINENNPEFERWLRKHRRFAGAMTVLSMLHIEVLRLLNSKLLGSELFNARFNRSALKKIFIGGLINVFIEDIPQLVIVVIYKQRTGTLELIPLLTMITSVIILLNDLISRIYELISIPRPSKTEENPANEKEDEDYVLSFFNKDPTAINPDSMNSNVSNNNSTTSLSSSSYNDHNKPNYYKKNSNNNSFHDLSNNNNNNNNNNSNHNNHNNHNNPSSITTPPIALPPIATNYNNVNTGVGVTPVYQTAPPIIQNYPPQQIEVSPNGELYTTSYVYVPNESQAYYYP